MQMVKQQRLSPAVTASISLSPHPVAKSLTPPTRDGSELLSNRLTSQHSIAWTEERFVGTAPSALTARSPAPSPVTPNQAPATPIQPPRTPLQDIVFTPTGERRPAPAKKPEHRPPKPALGELLYEPKPLSPLTMISTEPWSPPKCPLRKWLPKEQKQKSAEIEKHVHAKWKS
eukprot:TRINITY_DN9773_c0_g1_i2.p1 TRINITY_DN9773_c0_g1~~TRINITY_DN9773_c0_g1_i2.p1  ORF type:complete len:173 (-),score=24.27 TRINITY_DN9773_c0_g1_i2:650-1168(-)